MGKASMLQLRRAADDIGYKEPGKEFKVDRTPLTDDEMRMLMRELNRMMVMTNSTIQRKLLTYHIAYVVFAAEVAKKYFEPKSFGGRMPADTQYGLDSIRPAALGLNTTGLVPSTTPKTTSIPVSDWGIQYTDEVDASDQGFNHWICGSTAAANYTIKEDSLMIITALVNYTRDLKGTAPLATAIKPNLLNGEEKPVITLTPMYIGDMPAMVLPVPWLLIPKTELRVQKQIRGNGMDCLALFGIEFGTGTFLKKENQFNAD